MATLTPNIGLTMPARNENVLVSVLNSNFLKIDEVVKEIQDKTQPATETEAGIISINEIIQAIRMSETLNILGLEYGGDFGTDLTSIEADKVYFYKDTTTGRVTPYVALADNSPGPFITPDVNNFRSLTNRDNLFYKKLNISVPTLNNITLMNAYIFGNILLITGFIIDPAPFNSAVLDTEFVNLTTMIPEITDYATSSESDTISAINLVIKSNFALAKSSSGITFYLGQHFTVITGVTQGTIR